VDTDCDGNLPDDEIDWDDDGWSQCDGDCNEGDRFINPGEEEQCDGVDNDCMGGVDPLFCDLDCEPTGCLCSVGPGPMVGWWTLMLLVFANRRRRRK
jgi:MYXO-CTERM domain-containing protein